MCLSTKIENINMNILTMKIGWTFVTNKKYQETNFYKTSETKIHWLAVKNKNFI